MRKLYTLPCIRITSIIAVVTGLCLMFFSCGWNGTIRKEMSTEAFKNENLPLRTLKIAVFTDHSCSDSDVRELISKTSESLREQVGMELAIVSWNEISWQSAKEMNRFYEFYYSALELDDKSYDMAMAFSSFSWIDRTLEVLSLIIPVPIHKGYIDGQYKRYIYIKTQDRWTLLQEIFHAFIFSHTHSGGIMSSALFQVFPFTPPLNQTLLLTPEDRREVLKNKWRQFYSPVSFGGPRKQGE